VAAAQQAVEDEPFAMKPPVGGSEIAATKARAKPSPRAGIVRRLMHVFHEALPAFSSNAPGRRTSDFVAGVVSM